MNLGAGRVVMQDLPRIDEAIDATARSPRTRRSLDFIADAEEERRHGASHGPAVAGRRPFAPGPYRGAGAQRSTPPGIPVAVHAFLDGRDTPPQERARAISPNSWPTRRGCKRIAHRHRRRPLLRHGPRQALGPGREGLARAGRWPRASARADAQARDRAILRPGQDRRVRAADGHRRLSRHDGRRRRADGQFPRRPRARDPGRAARSRLQAASRARASALRRGGRHGRIFGRAQPLHR